MDSITNAAKQLRKNLTPAERILWKYLRMKQLENLRFRRQEPIGSFIVDFVCFEKHIIIELDGGYHASQVVEDSLRSEWFKKQGFKILRFWNSEVLINIAGVMEVVRQSCVNPSPSPSHSGEGRLI